MSKEIAKFLVKIGVDVEGAEAAQKRVDEVKEETKELGDEAKKADSKVSTFSKGLREGLTKGAQIAAVAIAAAGAAIFKFVNDTTAAIDETNKLAAALGLPVEELQRLQFAAGQSGLENEKLSASIKRLNSEMLLMATGAAGPAKDALDILQISLEDLEPLNTTERLGLIGDSLALVEDAAQRSALSARIFGEEAGPAMASLLAAGTEGLQDMTAAAQGVVSQEDADRASAFQDRMGELNDTVQGLVASIAVDLLPVVEDIVLRIQAWLAENDEVVKQNMGAVISGIAEVIGALIQEISFLVEIGRAWAGLFSDLSERGGVLGEVMQVLISVVKAAITPFTTVRTLVGEIANLMAELGVITVKTADDFNASIGNMETSASGLDTVAGKFDNLTGSVSRTNDELFDFNAEIEKAQNQGFFIGSPEAVALGKATAIKTELKNRRNRPRGGGGARAPKAKTPKAPKVEKPPLPTVDEIIQGILSGRGDILAERIKGLSVPGSTQAAKPQVAIDFMLVEVKPGAIQVFSDNAGEAGQAVLNALRDEFRKAATALKPGPKR